MPHARVNSIEICFEELGSATDPALILINGLGSQMIRWPDALKQSFLDAGFRLITFDNRDIGLSTKFDDATDMPAYSVDDMADDAAALLAHLGIDAAHVAGMSMGGMIAQLLAIRHPERVLSLASIMSTTGGSDTVPSKPFAAAIFLEPAGGTREEAIDRDVRHRRIIGSPGFPFDEVAARDIATRSYDRCNSPEGRMRQMFAIREAPSRVDKLRELDVPTVVIHGTEDALVPFENGVLTANTIPGADLVPIEGMGHDLPAGALSAISDAIISNARRAVAAA